MDFDEYVAARGQALLRFGYVLSGDAYLAEDLVQTALLKAYSHWRRVTAADQPEAYLRRMIVNSFLDHRRRRSAHEVPVDLGRPFDPCPTNDDHVEWIVGRSEMWLALARLPKKQRAVLVLRYYEDLPDSTIATLLGPRWLRGSGPAQPRVPRRDRRRRLRRHRGRRPMSRPVNGPAAPSRGTPCGRSGRRRACPNGGGLTQVPRLTAWLKGSS